MGFTVAATGHMVAVCPVNSSAFGSSACAATGSTRGTATATAGVSSLSDPNSLILVARRGSLHDCQETSLFGSVSSDGIFINGGSANRASRRTGCTGATASRVGRHMAVLSPRGVAMQDSLAGMDEDPCEPRQYPPGLNRYETMVVLRPDMTEEERISLTERYEEAMVTGGALDVEMFNRGMQPLAYNIQMKNMGGMSNRYLDGIYLLFAYVTKPDSMIALQAKMKADDDVIRCTTFRLKI